MSPNSLALIRVVTHYIDDTYTVQTRLISLRRLRGAHSGENMAQVICSIIQEYEIAEKLGYFVLDNASANDVCVNKILAIVRPDILPREHSK